MPPPPIILIHRGDSFYLAHAIAQARSSNPDSRLILLGDSSNSFYLGVEHYRYEDYFDRAQEFAKLFTFEFFPSYQYPWILFCHQKYFALLDFIRTFGIERFLLIDSDVMIYERITPYFEHYAAYQMTLSQASAAYSAQAAFAVVNDASVISDLCRIYDELFRASPETLETRFGTRYFTEMLGLALLMKEPLARVKNTYGEDDKFVVCHNLIEDDRFVKNGEYSRIFWQGTIPMFCRLNTESFVKSPIIHFHGHAKRQMGRNLKLNGYKERLQHALNKTMSAAAKYPMRAANMIAGRSIFPGL